jgi:hypothetical protein
MIVRDDRPDGRAYVDAFIHCVGAHSFIGFVPFSCRATSLAASIKHLRFHKHKIAPKCQSKVAYKSLLLSYPTQLSDRAVSPDIRK